MNNITVRKKQILKGLASGKRAGDIADDLGISINTTRLHIRELKLILSASTTPELISKAIQEGVI